MLLLTVVLRKLNATIAKVCRSKAKQYESPPRHGLRDMYKDKKPTQQWLQVVDDADDDSTYSLLTLRGGNKWNQSG